MNRILAGAMIAQKLVLTGKDKMFKFSSKNMNKFRNHPHSLKRWVNVFFVMLILGLFFMSSCLYYYTTFYADISTQSKSEQAQNRDIKKVISTIQQGIVVFTTLIVGMFGIIWYYFIYFILAPLIKMKDIAEQIGHGQLNQTINIRAPLEIQRLSESINDLSVNLQETLLFVWNQTEVSLRCLNIDETENYNSENIINAINTVKQNMIDLQRMISTYVLYDVRLDHNKVLDGSEQPEFNSMQKSIKAG
jgi:methyl-accepting chemotaxis protein